MNLLGTRQYLGFLSVLRFLHWTIDVEEGGDVREEKVAKGLSASADTFPLWAEQWLSRAPGGVTLQWGR